MRQEFTKATKLAAFQRSGGFCENSLCGIKLRPGQFDYDHDLPCEMGGEPTLENCKVLCKFCHRVKTNRDVATIAKSNRQRALHLGIKRKGRPMPGSRASGWKHKISGEWVRR